ncbi:uncharacterized protein LOC125314873 [Rhodamnia argentea]|uniref:Uncharacterized protein LOC125314873 n=1 Tax=Rhodamnia argentea TaxID=178133 RepID=A0ABM3HBW2_9MYRT|nr:uncharacterized protein LOC125314873 [Rhodamnia argentea]
MNGGNMKRVTENPHEFIPASAEVGAKLRHEYLLQDYQDLQKEFVPEKKKLQEEKEKKQTLLDEVHFLRARYQYLMELQSRGTRAKEALGVANTGIEEWNNSAAKAVSEHSLPVLEREIEKDKLAEGMEEADRWRPREQLKYKSTSKSNKKVDKKVSWQDLEAKTRYLVLGGKGQIERTQMSVTENHREYSNVPPNGSNAECLTCQAEKSKNTKQLWSIQKWKMLSVTKVSMIQREERILRIAQLDHAM